MEVFDMLHVMNPVPLAKETGTRFKSSGLYVIIAGQADFKEKYSKRPLPVDKDYKFKQGKNNILCRYEGFDVLYGDLLCSGQPSRVGNIIKVNFIYLFS